MPELNQTASAGRSEPSPQVRYGGLNREPNEQHGACKLNYSEVLVIVGAAILRQLAEFELSVNLWMSNTRANSRCSGPWRIHEQKPP